MIICDMRVRSRDGQWTIDVIRLECTGTGRDGEWIRVKRHGAFVLETRSIEQLAQLVDLADLIEALGAGPGRGLRAAPA